MICELHVEYDFAGLLIAHTEKNKVNQLGCGEMNKSAK